MYVRIPSGNLKMYFLSTLLITVSPVISLSWLKLTIVSNHISVIDYSRTKDPMISVTQITKKQYKTNTLRMYVRGRPSLLFDLLSLKILFMI